MRAQRISLNFETERSLLGLILKLPETGDSIFLHFKRNVYNCYSMPVAPQYFERPLLASLVSRIQRLGGIVSQDVSSPEPHPYLIWIMQLGTLELMRFT